MKKIFLIASIAIATTSFAQKANNTLQFKKGQKLEVTTETNKTSSVELMGQTIETKVTSTLNEVLDVQDANKSGATLQHSIKQLKFNLINPMQSQSFDSEKEADQNGEIGKMLGKNLKSKYIMTLDATGNVINVKTDDTTDKNKETADMADLIAAQLGMNMIAPKVGEASSFKILPDKEVSAGDTWTDSSSANGQTKKTTYTVKSITANEIVLDYTEQLNINTTQQIMGTDATIKTNDNTTGTITLDKTSGLLKQRTANMEETGTMEAQGQSIPVKGKTSITVTVKPA